MIRFFNKIFSLKFQLYSLYIETFFLSGLVHFALVIFPFSYFKSIFIQFNSKKNFIALFADQKSELEKVGLAISRISKYTPWRCMCLEQAITAKLLLRKKDIQTTLYLGVANNENLMAHAWLKYGDTIITGENHKDNFQTLAYFT